MSQTNQLQRALQRTALLVVRQSTMKQVSQNIGSGYHQRDVRDSLRAVGWPDELIEIVDLGGESASGMSPRPRFQSVVERVRSGEIGLISAARDDRLARNTLDNESLLDAAAQTGTYILISGRLYNPASDADTMMLKTMAAFSEYENKARIRWQLSARFAKARRGHLRIALPLGLVWADPTDLKYREAAEAAGLESYLELANEHWVKANDGRRDLRIMPYPDNEVHAELSKLISWLLDTGDARVVLKRIMSGSDWPHPAKMPKHAKYWQPGAEVEWREHNYEDLRTRFRQWISSPTLYGIYGFRAPRLAAMTPDAAFADFEVERRDAFVGFGGYEMLTQVRDILDRSAKKWKRGEFNGHRSHALEQVYCAEPLHPSHVPTRRERYFEGVRVCGHRLSVVYPRTEPKGHRYASQKCKHSGHRVPTVQAGLDDVVLKTICDVLSPCAVEEAVSKIEIDAANAHGRMGALRERLQVMKNDIRTATKIVLDAEGKGNTILSAHWNDVLEGLKTEERLANQELTRAQLEAERFKALTKAEVAEVRGLAADLPSLLERARVVDADLLRRTVRTLVRKVLFQRHSLFCYEASIVFAAGGVVRRAVQAKSFKVPQAAIAWAHGRKASGVECTTIVNELNALTTKVLCEWTLERVDVAFHLHEHIAEHRVRRAGQHFSVEQLAGRLRVPRDRVLSAAVSGRLGPGYYDQGDLWLCPTPFELDRDFPEAVRRRVSEERGWHFDDTVPATQLAEELGIGRQRIQRFATSEGLVRDGSSRVWLNRQDVVHSVDRAIAEAAEAVNPEWLTLDPAGWIPFYILFKAQPHLKVWQVRKHYPVVSTQVGYAKNSSYAWCEPLARESKTPEERFRLLTAVPPEMKVAAQRRSLRRRRERTTME